MSANLRKIVYKSNIVGSVLGYFVTKFQFMLLGFYKDQKIVNLIKSVKNDVDFAFYPYEAYMIYSLVKSQSKVDGSMAEVGVYQGGSAKIICEAKGDKELHLFDTFTGLPTVTDKDTHFGIKHWKDNEFDNTSEDRVKKFLSNYKNVFLHKGRFPDTANPIKNLKFSFVHLDVDLYESTKNCLDFFYPLLVAGGIMLTHDYHTEGVKSAFAEFLSDKNMLIVELTGSQCFVVKPRD